MESFANLTDEENAKLREKRQDVILNKSSASSLIDYQLAMNGKKIVLLVLLCIHFYNMLHIN